MISAAKTIAESDEPNVFLFSLLNLLPLRLCGESNPNSFCVSGFVVLGSDHLSYES